jgi:hypothetical protein
MDYKVVKRPHVVPRGYLRGFAVNDLIAMRLVGESASREVPVGKAGVLKEFYRRHRPDGTPIYDVEWSLEHIDRAVPPILREISERWPLSIQEKSILAEFVGMQVVRGARWRAWHRGFTSDFIAEARASGEYEGSQPEGMSIDEAIAEAEGSLSSDTAALTKMLELSRKTTQIVGSMHWSLIEFERPWVATSDHPFVIWKLGLSSRQPKKSEDFFESGFLNTLEARFPVSASRVLLMTWADAPDSEAQRVVGNKEIAGNLNAFTVAEAEHQWFHMPRTRVPAASGQLLPLAPRVLHGYSADVARTSRRRSATSQGIQPKIGTRDLAGGFELVWIGPGGELEIVKVKPPSSALSERSGGVSI